MVSLWHTKLQKPESNLLPIHASLIPPPEPSEWRNYPCWTLSCVLSLSNDGVGCGDLPQRTGIKSFFIPHPSTPFGYPPTTLLFQTSLSWCFPSLSFTLGLTSSSHSSPPLFRSSSHSQRALPSTHSLPLSISLSLYLRCTLAASEGAECPWLPRENGWRGFLVLRGTSQPRATVA